MLAYVFWHVKQSDTPPAEYEEALKRFHESLRADPPTGFERSLTFRVQGGEWIPQGEGYEDWYLVRDSSALDSLNRGAVTGSNLDSHEATARLATWGSAGLYRPFGGDPVELDARSALWFDKPREVSYQALRSRLEANQPGITRQLWQRQMTLGPTPEFCLLGRGAEALPYGWNGQLIVRRALLD